MNPIAMAGVVCFPKLQWGTRTQLWKDFLGNAEDLDYPNHMLNKHPLLTNATILILLGLSQRSLGWPFLWGRGVSTTNRPLQE
jgi:hypothetical protein